MYEFAYCFAMDGRVNWSAETANSLSRWIKDEDDQELVTEFIENSEPGNFITLKDGTLISRCSPTIKPHPRTTLTLLSKDHCGGIIN